MNNMLTYPQRSERSMVRSADPVRELFDRVFEGRLFPMSIGDESSVVTSQWSPPVDVIEEPERFVVYADIPGVDPRDIEVQMDGGLITIRGERRSEGTVEDGRYSRAERMHGVFHRRFALPDSADPDQISASGFNGVLQVVIPKRPESKPRRIKVDSVLNS